MFLFFENVTTIPRNQSFESKLPKDERKLAFLFLITIKNDLHGKFVDALALWQLFVNNPVLSFSNASSFFSIINLTSARTFFPKFFVINGEN